MDVKAIKQMSLLNVSFVVNWFFTLLSLFHNAYYHIIITIPSLKFSRFSLHPQKNLHSIANIDYFPKKRG